MPLVLSLVAPGSPYRFGRRVTRLLPHWVGPHAMFKAYYVLTCFASIFVIP